MRYSSTNRGLPAGSPIANAFVIIVGTLVIAASVVVGFFAFVVVGTALIVLAAIVGIRLWWLRRKFGNQVGGPPPRSGGRAAGSQTIEGEYRVVSEDRDDTTG